MCYANVPFWEQSRDKCGHHGRRRWDLPWWQTVCYPIRGCATLYLEVLLIWTWFLVIAFSANCLSLNLILCWWEKTGNDSYSETSLLCRLGQLGGQAMPPCLRFWSCGNGEGKILILSSWNEFLAIFLGGNKQGMGSLWTLGNYLHIWVGKECWLTKRKWLWETSPLEQLELSQFSSGHWDKRLTPCPSLGLQCFSFPFLLSCVNSYPSHSSCPVSKQQTPICVCRPSASSVFSLAHQVPGGLRSNVSAGASNGCLCYGHFIVIGQSDIKGSYW